MKVTRLQSRTFWSILGWRYVLVFDDKEDLSVKGFMDARFFMLNGGEVTWRSSKQETITVSTIELEYVAKKEAWKDVMWLKKFNKGVTALAKEPGDHKYISDILIKFHYIRNLVEDRDIMVSRVPSEDNIVDPLTKPLEKIKHDAHTRSIDIWYANELVYITWFVVWFYGTCLDYV